MAQDKKAKMQPNPNKPQAPDNVQVDPLRLHFNGVPLFRPADRLGEGADHQYTRTKHPFFRELLDGARASGNGELPVKCMPDPDAIMAMCLDISGQLDLSPRDGDDEFYVPKLIISDFPMEILTEHEVQVANTVSGARVQGVTVGGVDLKFATAAGYTPYLMQFDESLAPWYIMRNGDTTPMMAKVSEEANQVPGVACFGSFMPYTCVFLVPPLWKERTPKVHEELTNTVLRVMREVNASRLVNEAYKARNVR